MRRAAIAVRAAGLAAVLIAVSSGVALAEKGGAGTETITEHARDTVIFPPEVVKNPCTGEVGTLTSVAANAIFHVTTQADGNMWLTLNAEGTATFKPEKSGGVEYSGHFHDWFGQSLNTKNEVEHSTSTYVLRASNGSQVTVHTVGHLSTNAAGEVKAEFETTGVQCG
jgi:hypothetical protein